jgi:hypothetical protein
LDDEMDPFDDKNIADAKDSITDNDSLVENQA